MKDYKICVANEAESKEAQDFFELLGFKKQVWGIFPNEKYFIFANANYYSRDSVLNFSECDYKELTLPQLRDLVVLKRGDVGDANYTDSSRYDWYLDSNGKYHRYQGEIWVYQPFVDIEDLKPIEPKMSILDTGRLEMKEYLDPANSYKSIVTDKPFFDWIEVPEGADELLPFNHGATWEFYKNNRAEYFNQGKQRWMTVNSDHLGEKSALWQRQTQPEDLPFIDDEQSLNDQYAEIEKVRRKTYGFTPERAARISLKTEDAYLAISDTLKQRESIYGSFEDVASVTQDLLSVLKKTGLESLPKSHKEALHMICSKMARIVNGDFNHIDGWHDIGGYAKLIENLIGEDSK